MRYPRDFFYLIDRWELLSNVDLQIDFPFFFFTASSYSPGYSVIDRCPRIGFILGGS